MAKSNVQRPARMMGMTALQNRPRRPWLLAGLCTTSVLAATVWLQRVRSMYIVLPISELSSTPSRVPDGPSFPDFLLEKRRSPGGTSSRVNAQSLALRHAAKVRGTELRYSYVPSASMPPLPLDACGTLLLQLWLQAGGSPSSCVVAVAVARALADQAHGETEAALPSLLLPCEAG